jgi:hypothetical protein
VRTSNFSIRQQTNGRDPPVQPRTENEPSYRSCRSATHSATQTPRNIIRLIEDRCAQEEPADSAGYCSQDSAGTTSLD